MQVTVIKYDLIVYTYHNLNGMYIVRHDYVREKKIFSKVLKIMLVILEILIIAERR